MTSRELAFGDNADIYTVGGRLTGFRASIGSTRSMAPISSARSRTPRSPPTRTATAISTPLASRLSYLFRDSLNNQLHVVGEYLSGDNDSTDGKDEMFDILGPVAALQ